MSLHIRRFSMLGLSLLGILFLGHRLPQSGAASEPVFDWVVECMDCPRFFDEMSPRSAAYDAEGTLHVAYGGDHLYHSYQSAAERWVTEVVDGESEVGLHATLGLDSGGHPHIVYYDAGSQRSKYARHDGTQWHIEAIPTGAIVAAETSLVIDKTDRPHITFYDGAAGDLLYGYREALGWLFTVVDAVGDVGQFSSLVLDSKGYPHISYHDATHNRLKYAYFDGTSWTSGVFRDKGWEGYDTSIVVDSNDFAHIAFRGRGTDGLAALMYLFEDKQGWHIELVEEEDYLPYDVGEVGHYTSLQLDREGSAHISHSSFWYNIPPYPPDSTYRLRYAYRSSAGDWQVALVDDWESEFGSLLIAPSEYPVIVYKSRNVLTLAEMATKSGWTFQEIDQSEYVGQSASLAIDRLGRTHVSYHEADDFSLKYALSQAAGWSASRVTGAGRNSSNRTALALDSDGHPHILYRVWSRFTSGVRYAYLDRQGWVLSTVPFGVSVPDLDIDGEDKLHLTDAWSAGLYYIRWDGEWQSPILIDSNGRGVPSIAVEPSGLAHIAYRASIDYRQFSLRHAVNTPSGWLTSTVTGDNADYVSITLDRARRPYISYYEVTGSDLKYARYDGAAWHSGVVDADGDVGRYSSIAVGAQGQVHICYYDASNRDLKYALWTGQEWHTETIVSNGDVGSHCSLELDWRGLPQIAFHDASLGDLKLARVRFEPSVFVHLPIVRR